ncbi:MAG: DNA topoisomerase, partial [Oscillospiraceae bacterium]
RVQTPTLTILTEREKEIKSFISRTFYTINADLKKLFVTWRDAKNNGQIFDKSNAEAIKSKIQGKPFKLTSLRSQDKKTPPPLLYDLTELQRDANKLYGYSPKQ